MGKRVGKRARLNIKDHLAHIQLILNELEKRYLTDDTLLAREVRIASMYNKAIIAKHANSRKDIRN